MDKKTQKIDKDTKPFLKGNLVDRATISSALKFMGCMVVTCILFVAIGMMLTLEIQWLNIIVNMGILLAAYLFFLQLGQGAGADAVNQGEIMYARQEKGRPVAAWERGMCYHPLKGLISALIGTTPLLLISLLFACIAQRQMTGLGVLPSWVSSVEARAEIGAALAYYHEAANVTLESALRVLVRISTMPYVNMIGVDNHDALLMLERVSPVLNMLPAIFFGAGYCGGVNVRASIHTSIALGKKKAKRKQARERRSRQQGSGGSNMLN